jgi:hypothetical protein
VNEYTVIIAVTSGGAPEPRLVLKHVTTTSAPVAIAEATAAVYWQHDDDTPTIGDALVFDGRLDIASQGRRTRRTPSIVPSPNAAARSTRPVANAPRTTHAGAVIPQRTACRQG